MPSTHMRTRTRAHQHEYPYLPIAIRFLTIGLCYHTDWFLLLLLFFIRVVESFISRVNAQQCNGARSTQADSRIDRIYVVYGRLTLDSVPCAWSMHWYRTWFTANDSRLDWSVNETQKLMAFFIIKKAKRGCCDCSSLAEFADIYVWSRYCWQ